MAEFIKHPSYGYARPSQIEELKKPITPSRRAQIMADIAAQTKAGRSAERKAEKAGR